jgi:hypothetical protein
MQHLPLTTFRRCVARYRGEHKIKSVSCLDQFLSMAFAQLTYRESLRDIEACLRAQRSKLYHLGIRSVVARNTQANANTVFDWRMYADFGQSLIGIARRLYTEVLRSRFEGIGLRSGYDDDRLVPVGCFLGRHFVRPRSPSNCTPCCKGPTLLTPGTKKSSGPACPISNRPSTKKASGRFVGHGRSQEMAETAVLLLATDRQRRGRRLPSRARSSMWSLTADQRRQNRPGKNR